MPSGARGGTWPRRVVVPAGPQPRVRTASVLAARKPGIVRFAWTVLVVLGMLSGLGLQAALLAAARLPVGPALVLSASAIAGGLAGGKAWYIAKHRGRRLDGWCIQGFIAGAAVIAGTLLLAGTGVPAGAYLNAAAPGLMLGMAIGRPGCFWAGCCTGRPTASRFGIWSSDRRLGMRRVPVQLMEALLALVIGLGALIAAALAGTGGRGLVLGGAVPAYTLGRQFLLGLRAEPPRSSPLTGRVTTAVAAAALIADIVVAAIL